MHHGSLRVLTTAKSKEEDADVMADPVAVIILSVIACMLCAVLLKEMECVWAGTAAGAAFGRNLSAPKTDDRLPIVGGSLEKLVSLERGYVCALVGHW